MKSNKRVVRVEEDLEENSQASPGRLRQGQISRCWELESACVMKDNRSRSGRAIGEGDRRMRDSRGEPEHTHPKVQGRHRADTHLVRWTLLCLRCEQHSTAFDRKRQGMENGREEKQRLWSLKERQHEPLARTFSALQKKKRRKIGAKNLGFPAKRSTAE
jgi:hypothetical protein